MKSKLPVMAVTALTVIGISTALADTQHPKHHHRHVYHAAPARVVPLGPAHAGRPVTSQPYMYEARPGLWISSWDCITDEGQGRWWPCSSLGGGSRN
jgi:hypothetical protein